MERSGSAGFRVRGWRVIEFGDFPEGVRLGWTESERRRDEVRRGFEEGVGLGIKR
jgi:hypothetical protein